MPRIPRGQLAGHAYHVLNRGNAQATVFHNEGDYRAFLELLTRAKRKFPVRLFGFCLMPNHFHLVLQPNSADTLSALMQWWLTSHVRRYHQLYGSSGHVWQGRFKSFPIQRDDHLLSALRYVVGNPVRAKLVYRPQDWPWTSLQHPMLIDPWPVPRPPHWEEWLLQPLAETDLTTLRTSVNRQRPFGTAEWQLRVARRAGLESTLRPRGRPRTRPEK